MKILDLIKSREWIQSEVDGIPLKFKTLTWGELVEFQSTQEKIGTDNGQKLCFYIIDKYVRDEDGNKIIESEEQISEIPVDFSVKVMDKFSETITGNVETVKK